MPIYTYRCANCGTELDHRQGFSDPPLSHCPVCAQEQLQRVYKPIPVVFKGSGFYATDHRSPSGVGKNVNGATSKGAEGESKSSESSSESGTKSAEGSKSESTAASTPAQTVS